MISEQLQKKVNQSIRLLQSIEKQAIRGGYSQPIEIAYSGGKDSDVILQLAKEAGINYRAIYKNTTIDPPGTIAHAKEMGAEILQPKNGMTFFKLVEKNGYPSRLRRFCCKKLKEYKVLDKCVMGVRKSESTKRAKRYSEPTECRFYGNKRDHVEAIYPILDWETKDVAAFIEDRGIKCAPIYYDEQGVFHAERRLGCMCCPLAYWKHRVNEFRAHPNMVKAYVRAGRKYMESHPDSKLFEKYGDAYTYFYRNLFCDSEESFRQKSDGLFGKPDYKSFLEEYFGITFNE